MMIHQQQPWNSACLPFTSQTRRGWLANLSVEGFCRGVVSHFRHGEEEAAVDAFFIHCQDPYKKASPFS